MTAVFFVVTILLPLAYANAFVGCVTQSFTTYDQITSAATVSSASACAAFCATSLLIPRNVPTPYSYYRQNDAQCLCSAVPPSANSYRLSNTVNGPADLCIIDTFYSVYRLRTTFNFDRCYGGVTTAAPAFSTVNGCFDSCRYTSGVLFSADRTASGVFRCLCGAESRPATASPIACGDGTGRYFFYTHPFPDASAGNLRRRKQKAIHREEYCPAGLTACRVGGTEGYECIDTATELESCGGCIHGRFGEASRGPIGVNCVELGGEDLTSMTCNRGRCVEAF